MYLCYRIRAEITFLLKIFKVVELMGYEWAKENLIHVPYGLVSLEGGKLSTRSGNIVYAEDILKESVSKIREIIAEKNPDLKDKEDVAQKVGIGAIIFNDLYNQRIKDVTFTWEKIHSFDGENRSLCSVHICTCGKCIKKNRNHRSGWRSIHL